jgi:hypothetical protein
MSEVDERAVGALKTVETITLLIANRRVSPEAAKQACRW